MNNTKVVLAIGYKFLKKHHRMVWASDDDDDDTNEDASKAPAADVIVCDDDDELSVTVINNYLFHACVGVDETAEKVQGVIYNQYINIQCVVWTTHYWCLLVMLILDSCTVFPRIVVCPLALTI